MTLKVLNVNRFQQCNEWIHLRLEFTQEKDISNCQFPIYRWLHISNNMYSQRSYFHFFVCSFSFSFVVFLLLEQQEETFQFVILFNGWNVLCHCLFSVIHSCCFFFRSKNISKLHQHPELLMFGKVFPWLPQIQR